jgi:hypothetical protein
LSPDDEDGLPVYRYQWMQMQMQMQMQMV